MRVLLAAFFCLCAAVTAPAATLDERLSGAAADADALFRSGDLEGASEMLEQTLAGAEAMFGDEHADVAELTSRLSLLYLYRNDLERAERYAERALAVRQKIFGELHPTVAASLVDLASIRLVQGRDDDAGRIYRRVVDLWTRAAGAGDPRTAQARANLGDFLEARGRLAEAQALRQVGTEAKSATDSPVAAPVCPVGAGELEPPAWNTSLANSLFTVALEHEERIEHALAPIVHNFSALPDRAVFDDVFPADAERAYGLGRDIRALAGKRDPALLSLLALMYVARERLNVAALERFAPSPGDAPDYHAIVADVRRRVLVGLTRVELTRTPGMTGILDDAPTLSARREQIAKLLRPIGFDVNNEIKYRPEFLACVAISRPSDGFDYPALREAAEVIARNAGVLDAFLRFSGLDLDAVLKAYARSKRKGDQGLERIAPGVQLDRFNRAVFLDAYPASFVVHLQPSSRDRVADFAALVSQWEHGEFPRATLAQVESLVLAARRDTDTGPLAETLEAVALDLRTRYPAAEDGTANPDAGWAQPRVGRWERTRVGRDQHNTLYELQFDTHGSFAVPSNDLFLTKRLASPVGMMVGLSLRRLDLPKHALDAFAEQSPTLHVAVLPDPGLSFEVYAHPRQLTRAPGVAPAAFGETPLRPAPPEGWEIRPFARVAEDAALEDRILFDMHPIPGIEPAEARSIGLHACLLTPLQARNEGTTVHFASPIWRDPKDVPVSARFLVYRRRAGTRFGAWEEVAGKPLSLEPGLDYPADRVSPLSAVTRNGYVEFSLTDFTADPVKYEYQVLHRCALKPYPEKPPGGPARPTSAFEILAVEHSPQGQLRCNVRKGYGGIARPWVRVRYRVREDTGKAWRDRVSVFDPNGHELSGRNAVTTKRDPPAAAPEPGMEYSLLTSIAACTEGPYRFNIRFEGNGFSQEVAETLYVSVARER